MFRKNLLQEIVMICVIISLGLLSNSSVWVTNLYCESNISIYGTPVEFIPNQNPFPTGHYQVPKIKGSLQNDVFATTTFTFADIVIFSYFDSTEITIYNESEIIVDSYIINEDEYRVSSPGEGIYQVEGSKTYSVLIGDPITSYVLGFYAVNENGHPLSTKLNTYMSSYYYGGEYFILFAYEDNTEYQLKNLTTGNLISAGILNKGEHYISNEYNVFLNLSSNKPMSALTYTDQGYYYPASNGSFAGTLFYGFSGYVGDWTNGVIVTSYEDNNDILITNTETRDTIWAGTLNEGDVHAELIYTDTYVTVQSNKLITVANTPYAGWTGNYAYLTRHIDKDGLGVGILFYVPTIYGRFDVFSYADSNNITITDMDDTSEVWSGTLDEGDGYSFTSNHSIYKVESTENVSIVTSYAGTCGADFMPLNYATTLPDLSISATDISFDPDSVNAGDPVVISADVHNYSSIGVEDVIVQFFDGDPQGGGLQIGEDQSIPIIDAHTAETVSINWIAPEIPEVHFVYVWIEPYNTITESNESNNIAVKPLIPNEDLLPPLSIMIDAPFALEIVADTLTSNPFDVLATIFNNGDVEAINVVATMNDLPDGLQLDPSSNPAVQNLGNLASGESVQVIWTIYANEDASGILVYSVLFNADNVEDKTVMRGVNVPDITPPSPPTGFNVVSSGNGVITVSWNQNPEPDVFGYLLFYDSDESGPPYEGVDALEGSSPIDVANNLSFTLTGLDINLIYYLNLKAYDTTPNSSNFTDEVSASPSGSVIPNFSQNPFNPGDGSGTFYPNFDDPLSPVKVKIYDVSNQLVAELDALTWDGKNDVGKDVANGVYFCLIENEAGEKVIIKIAVLR